MNYGIGNVKGAGGASNTILTTTTDATENSGTYTLALTYLAETPKVNDYVVYVNSGNLTTLYQVSAVDTYNATLTKIGDIGGSSGGTTLYQHSIYLVGTSSGWIIFNIINDDSTPFTTTTAIAKWLYDNGFTTNSDYYMHGLMANGVDRANSKLITGVGSTDGISLVVATDYANQASFSSKGYNTIFDNVIELGTASINGGGGGSQKYQHNIQIWQNSGTPTYNYRFTLKVITDSATEFDVSTLNTWLINNNYRNGSPARYEATGKLVYSNVMYLIFSLSGSSGGLQAECMPIIDSSGTPDFSTTRTNYTIDTPSIADSVVAL